MCGSNKALPHSFVIKNAKGYHVPCWDLLEDDMKIEIRQKRDQYDLTCNNTPM